MFIKNNPIRPGTAQKVAYTNSSAQSAATNAKTVLLTSTTDCHVVIGANPTATSSDTFLPAKTPGLFGCAPTDLVAVIQDASGGNLFITPAV